MYDSTASLTSPDRWDRLGVLLSGLCVAHCLWMPVLLASLPLWPAAVHAHAWAHPVIAVVLFPVTLLAVRTALRRRSGAAVPVLLAAGFVLIVTAFGLHDRIGDAGEALMTIAGSFTLIGGHALNWRSRTRRPSCTVC